MGASAKGRLEVEGRLPWLECAVGMARGEAQAREQAEALVARKVQEGAPVQSERGLLWALLAEPLRHEGLIFLDQSGALGQLLPCWQGEQGRRNKRLAAVEQLHVEAWREGMTDEVFAAICDDQDVVVDGRLNRWALTALAILLASGDIEQRQQWIRKVRVDLHGLGATEAEISWIESVLEATPEGYKALAGQGSDGSLPSAVVLSVLSTLATETPQELRQAVQQANRLLLSRVNPLDEDEASGD